LIEIAYKAQKAWKKQEKIDYAQLIKM
jgi:hypothetical protein